MVRKIQAAGFRIAAVPVHHSRRTHGRAQFFNLRRVVRTGRDMLKLWCQLILIRRSESGATTQAHANRAASVDGPPAP